MFENKIGLFLPSLKVNNGKESFDAGIKIGFKNFQVWCIDKDVAHEEQIGTTVEDIQDAIK